MVIQADGTCVTSGQEKLRARPNYPFFFCPTAGHMCCGGTVRLKVPGLLTCCVKDSSWRDTRAHHGPCENKK